MKNMFRGIRTLIAVLVLTLGLMPMHSALAAGPTTVRISVPSGVNAGAQFTISIIIEPGSAIAGAQFNLAFDAAKITVNSVTQGNLLTQGGASVYFNSGTTNNTAGTISGVAGAITTPGQSVSTNGTFATITMTASALGGTSNLTLSGVIVGDVNGQAVAITVVSNQVAINRAPVLGAIGAKSANEGALLSSTISATDADANPLVYTATGLPNGASFNGTTRAFSWTPRYDQAGAYTVRFQVSDGLLTVFEDVVITIIRPYPNWDVNADGATNVLDMVAVGQRWSATGLTGWIREDANEDGVISVLDMIIIGQHWTG
jgi:hypothetical protein